MERCLLISSLLFFISFCTLVSASSKYVSAIFTFGDSIMDAGTNHFLKNSTTQADFPPYGSSFFHHPTGRFTNGRTVVDFISQFMGIGFQKPFLEAQLEVVNGTSKGYPPNGLNFASGGSGVLRQTNSNAGVISFQEQLQQFRSLVMHNKIPKKLVEQSVFFIESGSNDIFAYFNPLTTSALSPEAYVQAMLTEVEHFIDQIYKLGARRIAIFSLGPLGCVPARALFPGAPLDRCHGKIDKMAKNYNGGLEKIALTMKHKHLGAFGVYGAVYKTVQLFRTKPRLYGFSNVSSACCGEGTLGGTVQCGREGYRVCQNPNKFLFWDSVHPSEHTYELVSKALWGGKSARIRPINLRTLARLQA